MFGQNIIDKAKIGQPDILVWPRFMFALKYTNDGRVTHWLECLSHKEKVVGSIPTSASNILNFLSSRKKNKIVWFQKLDFTSCKKYVKNLIIELGLR